MRKIKKIILHCSDSSFGDTNLIDVWHRGRGWNGIGYHYLILNGLLKKYSEFDPSFDGLLQPGRPIVKIGAHCRGHNRDSVGICLIGSHLFSGRQLLLTLPDCLAELLNQYELQPSDVVGHHELDSRKTCPNLDMNMIRACVEKKILIGRLCKINL